MSAPIAYVRSCVPQALAALVDRPVEEMAGTLWEAGAARPLGSSPGGVTYGTDPHRAGDVAVRLGHPVQWWRPDGTMLLSAREYLRFLRSRAHHRATTVLRPRPSKEDEGEEPARLPGDPELGPALSVRDWRDRHSSGRWLLIVRTDPGRTHAVALDDAEIVAGGEQYRGHTLAAALRILQPRLTDA